MVNEFQLGEVIDFSDDVLYPCRARLWKGDSREEEVGGTIFGFATMPCIIDTTTGTYEVAAGMHFSAPDFVTILGGEGVLIVRIGVRGLFTLGGPIEATGRLR